MRLAAKKTGPTSSARVVDGKLILSYPEAITPVVWQMDLTQAKASALEVREVKGNFVLTLKTAKNETVEIAPFATKAEAVAALMGVSKALENAHGQIRPFGVISESIPQAAAAGIAPAKKGGRWTAGILGVLLVLALLLIWTSLAPRPPISMDTAGSATGQPTPAFGGQQDENGVPLSADEFLLKRQIR